jgi:hypothetical protein
MANQVHLIAELLNVSENEAHVFCREVQVQFVSPCKYATIKAALLRHPDKRLSVIETADAIERLREEVQRGREEVQRQFLEEKRKRRQQKNYKELFVAMKIREQQNVERLIESQQALQQWEQRQQLIELKHQRLNTRGHKTTGGRKQAMLNEERAFNAKHGIV